MSERDDSYTTCGERYRTPAHPEVIAGLGRMIWNFLNLEEAVVAVLFEAGDDVTESRKPMAGGKEDLLRALGTRLRREGAPEPVLAAIREAADAFHIALAEYRNAVGHAGPYTAGYDEEGTYRPGLGLSSKHLGDRAHEGAGLLQEAHRIEDAIDPLGRARQMVKDYGAGRGPSS